MGIKEEVEKVENHRKSMNMLLDDQLAALMKKCKHPNTNSYPARPGDPHNECKDCGKWW